MGHGRPRCAATISLAVPGPWLTSAALILAVSLHLAACRLDDLLRSPDETTPADSLPNNPSTVKATSLAFAVHPTNATVGTEIVPAIEVVALDELDAVDTSFTGEVIIALGANPGGGTLAGTTTRGAVAGVATFPGLAIDQVGSGYTLAASADSLNGATSNPFDVLAATGATLASVSGNGQQDTVAATLAQPYVVRATDAGGNPVSGVTVTWTVTEGGGSIAPASVATDAQGEARATHTLGQAAGPQAATAQAAGLAGSPVTFTAAARPGAATRLAFTVEPSDAAAGAAIVPPVELGARDQFENVATGFTGAVSLALGANPGGGILSGTTSRNAVDGVAAFPGLSIDEAGSGYTLTASAAGLTAATSAPFAVTSGSSAALAQVSGDGQQDTVAATLAQPYVVRVTDGSGNPVAGVTVSWAVTAGGGSIAPASTATDAQGAAQATHTLGPTAGAQSVAASAAGLTGSPATFTATAHPGRATRLAFAVQPSDAGAGAEIVPAIEVVSRDQFDNVATGFAGAVALALGANPSGGTLAGTTTRSAAEGVATFPGLSINRAGTGYTLRATASGLTAATSTPFTITAGAAAALSLVSGDGQEDTVASTLDNPYVVGVTDAAGNPVAGVTVTWAVSEGGGTITPASTTTNAQGRAQATHTLGTTAGTQSATAAAAGLAGSPVTFTATAGPDDAAMLVFVQHPTSTPAGAAISPPVQVVARDQYGNDDTNFEDEVAVALGTNPGGGTLSGTTAQDAVAGVATFPGLAIDRAGSGYTLTASADDIAGATSTAFDITAGAAAALVAVSGTGQQDTVAATLAAPYVVRVTDGSGNPIAGVTVTWAVTGGGGTIAPASADTDAQGEARATHTLGTTAGAQSATASAAGLQGSPVTFSATALHGDPAVLVYTQQPTNTQMGATISPAVRVAVRDQFGNLAIGFTGSVSISITPGTGTPLATLSGTRTRTPSEGVATFDNLSIDLVGLGYRLRAQGAGLTADSAPFDVTVLSGAVISGSEGSGRP